MSVLLLMGRLHSLTEVSLGYQLYSRWHAPRSRHQGMRGARHKSLLHLIGC